MALDALLEAQEAIYDVLVADSGVGALVDNRIYDSVPPDPTYPFVNVGEGDAVEADDKTKDGALQTATVHIWSRKDGFKEVKQIMGAVHTALHRIDLTVDGAEVGWIRWTSANWLKDPDGRTRHGIQNFEILTHDA